MGRKELRDRSIGLLKILIRATVETVMSIATVLANLQKRDGSARSLPSVQVAGMYKF